MPLLAVKFQYSLLPKPRDMAVEKDKLRAVIVQIGVNELYFVAANRRQILVVEQLHDARLGF